MTKIDARLGWDHYTALMRPGDEHARANAMLDNMRLHHKYECLADDRIFDTMIPEPEYRFYGARGNAVLRGMDEVKEFYASIWDAGTSLVELHVDRVAFADWGASADGRMRQQVPASAIGKSDGHYLVETHLSWSFPYEDVGDTVKLVGEICHIDAGGARVSPIDPDDVLTMDEAAAQFPD